MDAFIIPFAKSKTYWNRDLYKHTKPRFFDENKTEKMFRFTLIKISRI